MDTETFDKVSFEKFPKRFVFLLLGRVCIVFSEAVRKARYRQDAEQVYSQ